MDFRSPVGRVPLSPSHSLEMEEGKPSMGSSRESRDLEGQTSPQSQTDMRTAKPEQLMLSRDDTSVEKKGCGSLHS